MKFQPLIPNEMLAYSESASEWAAETGIVAKTVFYESSYSHLPLEVNLRKYSVNGRVLLVGTKFKYTFRVSLDNTKR